MTPADEGHRVFRWRFALLRNPTVWRTVPQPLGIPAPVEEAGPETFSERQMHFQKPGASPRVPKPYGRPLTEEEITLYPKRLVFIRKELKASDLRRHAVNEPAPVVSSYVKEMIETVEPRVHQFIPVEFIDDEGGNPFKNAPFYFFHCCNNIEPSVVLDWDFLRAKPGSVRIDRYGDECPTYTGPLRIRPDFETALHVFTMMRYRTRADPSGVQLTKGYDPKMYCSLPFVRAVFAKHPHAGKLDFNDFEEVPGARPATAWEWK